jgi:hypothetical protein
MNLLDLSNVSRRLGLDVASAFPDRLLVRDGRGESRTLVRSRARPIRPWPRTARCPIVRVAVSALCACPASATHLGYVKRP